MSETLDPTLRELNACGCCEGIAAVTPVEIQNRPGLTAIAYRVGIHPQFKETLISRLSDAKRPALSKLTTRDDDDFSIALLDAWSTVADVLTFYQERIANESYLRTATERVSLLELARLIGYELSPGVAASTYLAFTIEDTPGAFGQGFGTGTTAPNAPPKPPPPVTLAKGIKVQSVPGPDEKAQTFETIEEIEARAQWNALKPRLTLRQWLNGNMKMPIYLQGTATNLKTGDTVFLIDKTGAPHSAAILKMTVDNDAQTTRLEFDTAPSALPLFARPTHAQGSVNDFPNKEELDEEIVKKIIKKNWKTEDLEALASVQGWSLDDLAANIETVTSRPEVDPNKGFFALRQRAAIFGHNAPRWETLPVALRYSEPTYNTDGTRRAELSVPAFPVTYEGRTLAKDALIQETPGSIFLDSTYPAIVKGSWVVLKVPDGSGFRVRIYSVTDNIELTRSDFNISAKISRLTLNPAMFGRKFTIRKTSVFGQSEQLPLASLPITDEVKGSEVTLGGVYFGLKVGQKVILTGERTDLEGIYASETMTLKEVSIEEGFTVLVFDAPLINSYVRATVQINANIASATHGETVAETLGSGDAGKSFQSFTLRQPPLTYVSSSAPSGRASTLEVRVNDILWTEVPSFYGHKPEERIYITRTSDDGKTTVEFGDGQTGARLPTGQENVTATYRKGIGLAGLVKQDQLTQLMSRPLGLKGVTNPLPASGAADAEERDDARGNAPLTVLTLDRIVSLQDYEDFARAFAGIGKALATWTWNGERRGVFVTIAGPAGATIAKTGDPYEKLLAAMLASGDPTVPLNVESYTPRLFRIVARVKVKQPDYLPEKVLPVVEQKLRDEFSFDARRFGQPVALSEVVKVMQSVEGVVAVDVDKLYRADTPEKLHQRLDAALPQAGGEKVVAAELITLDPRPLNLEVMP
ncbi:MAG: putative baseplate assembly protein [Pyrinomonadaceae bacterium]